MSRGPLIFKARILSRPFRPRASGLRLDDVLRAWPLAGRREELSFVEAALEREGAGGVVLAGASGIGKTRLAAEVIERAGQRGLATAWAVGTHSARAIPFGALAHLLPDRLPGVEARQNLLRVAGDAIAERASGRALVIGVDDAHLLDDSSAALVHHLAVAGNALVVAAVRSGERTPDPIVALWKDGLAERLELQALARDELGDLVTKALGGPVQGSTLRRLWEVTLGNPLFLREIVLAALEAGTLAESPGGWQWTGSVGRVPRLYEVLEERLGRLSDEERGALEVAAAGEPLEASIIQAIASAEAVERLQRGGLLLEERDGRRIYARLAHPLYSEVVREGTPSLRGRAIRRRLADELEATGGRRREDLLRIATWRLDAGEAGNPAVLVSAARRAMSVLDFRLAGRLARAAADAGGGFEASHAVAEALVGEGRTEAAEEMLGTLEAAAEGEAQRAAASLARAQNLFWRLGRSAEAQQVLDAAEREIDDARLRDEIAAARATFALFLGDAPAALDIVMPILERAGSPDAAPLEAAMTAGWALIVVGRLEESIELNGQMREPAAAFADDAPFALEWFEKTLCCALHMAGRLEEAVEVGEAAHHRALERGADPARAMHGFALGWLAETQGRPTAAVEWLRDANAAFREADMFGHFPASLGQEALSQAALGDLNAAAAAQDEARATHVQSNRMADCFVERGEVWLAAASGETSRAIQTALACAESMRSMGFRMFEAEALFDAVRLGERRVAPARLAPLAEIVDGRLVGLYAAHADALVRRDADALIASASAFEELGALLLAAEACAEAARLHRDSGRASSALAAASRGQALAGQCQGASTPALAGLTEPLPLTRREREVATLAAGGLSNREIAERLVVSVRTIDNHLHSAYSKLGVTGRDELSALLDPVGPRRGVDRPLRS
jgi:DNA-binding CsgD family transcriptional regulator